MVQAWDLLQLLLLIPRLPILLPTITIPTIVWFAARHLTAVTSSTGTLRVNAVTAATVAGQTVCTGATATFTVSTSNTGSGSLTYQWYNNGSSLGSSATAAAYTTANNSSTNDNDTYYCVVRSANCTAVTSSTGTLRVNAVTAATVAGQTVCTGATATFTVSTSNTGSGSLTYQWFNNGSSLGSSATAAAYTTAKTVQPTITIPTIVWFERKLYRSYFFYRYLKSQCRYGCDSGRADRLYRGYRYIYCFYF